MPMRLAARPAQGSELDRQVLEFARTQLARHEALLSHRDIVGVTDFAAHSSDNRFYLAHLHNGTVASLRVAHGTGSDPYNDGLVTHFSNMIGSNATSRGAYLTGGMLSGKFGTSLRLDGVEAQNSNAFDRSIVVHGADYCSVDYLTRWGRLGRSNGSLAVAPDQFAEVLTRLAGGRLLYADSLGFA